MASVKLGRRYVASIAIAMGIITILTGYLLRINLSGEAQEYMVQGGVLDLTDWSIDDTETIKLNGQWEFYPGLLVQPGSIDTGSKNDYIEVPGDWSESLGQEGGNSDGTGTYRLIVKLPQDGVYGIKTNTIRTSSRIYLNGLEASSMGNPSEEKEDYLRDSRFMLGVVTSHNREIEILIQVSNYDFKSGGIIKPIQFGTYEAIMNYNNKSFVVDAFTVATCLTLCVYYIIIYANRKNEVYLAYFSGANFFMALYLSTFNEQILRLVMPYSFFLRTVIQIIPYALITYCITKFINHFFDNFEKARLANQLTAIIFIFFAVALYRPGMNLFVYLTRIHVIFLGIIVLRYVYIFYILIKELYKGTELIDYIIIIVISMAYYWLVMALKILFEISLGNMSAIMIIILMLSVGSMMNHQLNLDFKALNTLTEKLKRYDYLKDEFLARASHELRTPLHIILNSTKGILEGRNGALSLSQQENLMFIYQEGRRLSRLVEDLLDSSQIKSGEVKLRIRPVNAYRAAEEIVREIRIFIPEGRKLVIINRIPSSLPLLKADPDKFRQIIYNLLQNAVKFTNEGSITLSGHVEDGYAQITVSDTGLGIDKKYFNEIFDVFYQNNDDYSRQKGLGLGLPIVKNLVEQQGGSIYVESQHGKGSDFKFRLPLYKEGTDDQEEDFLKLQTINMDEFPNKDMNLDRERIKDIESPTILIVDDEPLNQKIILDILDPLDYNTILADRGEEALQALEKNKIDLVILDVMLPDMSGDKVCEKIRLKYDMTQLPVLILTASGRTADLTNSFNYGANDFQRKPVDGEELKSRIQSLLLMKRSVEEGLEKEFQYFYSQISPHFLYNTLNTIIGLSYTDVEKARQALGNLSIYFRGKLDLHRVKGLVTLEAEFDIIRAYLDIEQMRYGPRLEVEYEIEDGLKAMLPPLTLQPIAENAVKHGSVAKGQGGKIKISAKRQADGLIKILIEDNGQGMSQEKMKDVLDGNNRRIGFKNVVDKIRILREASFKLESEVGRGTRVEILLPEVKYHEGDFS